MSRAAWMLVAVAFLWGFSFTWMKAWQVASVECPGGELLSALTLIGLRSLLALPLLAVWQPKVVWNPTRAEHVGGVVLGVVFLVGSVLQTWALGGTSPALSSFFTSLASAWVPFMALALGQPVRLVTVLGLMVAIAGVGALVWQDDLEWKLGWGEWLTLIGSVFFALQVLVLDQLGKNMEPAHLSAGFLLSVGLGGGIGAVVMALVGPGLGAWGQWLGVMLMEPGTLGTLACLVLFPTVVGFHWMNTYQPLVSPSQAALIYLLEPVFSSLISVVVGYDRLTLSLIVGGILVLAGNLLVELPRLVRPSIESK